MTTALITGASRGRVLNVASVAAYQPGGPLMAAYYATKSYVLAFSKGLARELAGSGAPRLTAAAVARAGYRGLMRGRAVVVPGLVAKLLALAGELPPRRVALEVNRLLLRGTD